MSRQEMLSWTSLLFSICVVFFYVFTVFGWPETIPDYSDQFTKIFLNLFWFVLAVELIIGLTEHKTKVVKDERDEKIEAHGHKYAYSFLTAAISIILLQMFLSNLFGEEGGQYILLGSASMVIHLLFIALFSSNIIKRVTMIYHYRKNW